MYKKKYTRSQANWSDKLDTLMVYVMFLFLMMIIGQLIRAKINGWI